MHDIRVIELFGFAGLIGLAGLRRPVSTHRPGAQIRLLGLLGVVGLGGFWNPWLGACGAVGAFGVWNHQVPVLRRLAWAGLLAPIGLAMGAALTVLG